MNILKRSTALALLAFMLQINTVVYAATYAIGEKGPAGGIVFHITDGGEHGLEASGQLGLNKEMKGRVNWEDAKAMATKYGPGWYLPDIIELTRLYRYESQWLMDKEVVVNWSVSEGFLAGTAESLIFAPEITVTTRQKVSNRNGVRAVRPF